MKTFSLEPSNWNVHRDFAVWRIYSSGKAFCGNMRFWQSSRSIAGIAGFGGIETGRLEWRGRTGAPNRTLRESNASRNAARGRAWSWKSGGAIRWDSAIPARNHQHADASFFTKHAG